MKTILAVLFASLVAATTAAATGEQIFANNGKIIDLLSGKQVDWYACTAQGNYPDPTTCDHYIACTTALDAYQMPCADDLDGTRLHYVRDSGPVEADSRCDYPRNVQCNLTPVTTTAKPNPGDGKQCEIEGKLVQENTECDLKEDCGECGDCDWYLRCDDSTTPNKWIADKCDFQVSATTGNVHLEDKLFWNAGAPVTHGGFCTNWNNLNLTTQDKYLNDEDCKSPCEFKSDDEQMSGQKNVCIRRYWFTNPDFRMKVWSAPWNSFFCDGDTKWDNGKRTCVRCTASDDCTCS